MQYMEFVGAKGARKRPMLTLHYLLHQDRDQRAGTATATRRGQPNIIIFDGRFLIDSPHLHT